VVAAAVSLGSDGDPMSRDTYACCPERRELNVTSSCTHPFARRWRCRGERITVRGHASCTLLQLTRSVLSRRFSFAGRLSGMPSPTLELLVLSVQERQVLEGWARRRKTSQALALRSRIVLSSADGASVTAVAADLGVSRDTVRKWRGGSWCPGWRGWVITLGPGLLRRSPMSRSGHHQDAGRARARSQQTTAR
jgi:Homeodomain-like domain